MKKKEYPHQDLSLKDIKGEVWEDIPGLDGAYRISNFGRIKSLRRWVQRPSTGGYWSRDRIIKCNFQKQILKDKRTISYLAKTITYNGKNVSMRIARIVYYLFAKKFDLHNRSAIITYKDEDTFNICPSNLLLTNPSNIGLKSYKKNLRPRNAFGNTPLPVLQYDQQGNFLNSFFSISEAAKKTGIDAVNILDAIYNKINLRCGFLWKLGNNKKEQLTINATTRKKIEIKKKYNASISQYDFSGNKIKTHKNIRAAADTIGCAPYSIMQVVLNKAFSVKGFYWKLGNRLTKIDVQHLTEKKLEKLRKTLCRPIFQLNKDGKIIKEYFSITEAARVTGTSHEKISSAIRKKHRTAGFYWRYKTGKKK